MRIPVIRDGEVVEYVDECRARSMASQASINARFRQRNGKITAILLKNLGGSSAGYSHLSSRPVYFERIDGAQFGGINVLAKAKRGGFERWRDDEKFNPRRFNPDRIPTPIRSL